jgi:hypothetical protein
LGGDLVKPALIRRDQAEGLPARFERVVQGWDTANKASELSFRRLHELGCKIFLAGDFGRNRQAVRSKADPSRRRFGAGVGEPPWNHPQIRDISGRKG